jgi:HlyD family secretion protein
VKLSVAIVVLALVAAAAAGCKPQPPKAAAPLGPVLVASGTLNAVSTVQVSAQIPGQVKEIYADFKTAVKRGQPLARFDPAPYELRVKQAQADLDAARSAGASVKKLEAQLAQAQADLERSVIRAPVDGIVVLRNVDAGQSIAEAPPQVLFAIAPDLREMQVEASIDAADVGRVRVGMPASFSVEAFPRRTFSGEIRYIRKSPQSPASYTLVIAAANPDLALVPGMTASVRVALAEPNTAAGSSASTRP